MGDTTQKNLDTIIKCGVAFSELDPRSKVAFRVLTITFELLKQQKGRDQMVSDLTRQLKRILPFAKEALKEAIEENADILQKAIGRLYTLTTDVAEFSCDYVKRNRFNRLMKSVISNEDQDQINEFTSGFKELVEDFDRAVNVEMFKTVRSMEEKMLLDRLEPIKTVYKLDRGCMEGTRIGLLDDIVDWAIRPHPDGNVSGTANSRSVYWLYGIPGVGKTAMAHSICARLHQEGRLGGMFFCRRDDPDLSDPKSVLPTLVFNLAERWGAYRKLLADRLRKDPNLTRHSAENQLFSGLLDSLQNHPPHSLVLVIDALDECGDSLTRGSIIASIVDASSRVSWLRVIVTSRQDSDIESSFMRFDGRYSSKDLASDSNALRDIRLFTQKKLYPIANRCGFPNDWPGDQKLDEIVERSGGLFIFVETLSQLLARGLDPDKYLSEALVVGSGSALERLYNLYATSIRSQIGRDEEVFRSAIGAIIVTGQYRPLPDEAVAELTGLRTNIVTVLVNKLGSLLYRDAGMNGGIRIRHLSIIDFLTGASTPEDLRVDTKQTNRDVAISCFKLMTRELRFNICGIESSFTSNRDVIDLQSRVDRNMSAALQYSCIHWSDHLGHIPDTRHKGLIKGLDEFTRVPRLLYWMEALSVMGKVPIGDSLLRRASTWLKCSDLSVEQRLDDALKFILTFREPIMTSAPHIYISGFAFVPTETELWRDVKRSFRNLLVVTAGRKKSWPDRPHMLTGHRGRVKSVVHSVDGRRLISGSDDKTIRIWDAETGAVVGEPLEGHTDWVCSVAYSPDGRRIISGSGDNTIRIWDAETGAVVGEPLEGHTDWVCSVAYSPDGRSIISGSDDKTIRIWDAETGAAVGGALEGHTDRIRRVAYSPDGRRIISGSYDKTIRIWDAETRNVVGEPLEGHTDRVHSVAYSPDGRRIVSVSHDKTIRIWDAETGAVVGEPLEGHKEWILSVAYSPDGRRITSGSSDKTVRIWDAETGATVGEPLRGHNGSVFSVAYSLDGRRIISSSGDKTIRTWDAETGAVVGEPSEEHTGSFFSVAYSPDGRRIISGSDDKTIRIWDAETGAVVGEPLKGHADWVVSVAYSPDGRRIISGSHYNDKTIRIWDAETGAVVGEPLEGHNGSFSSVAYSPDGRRIVGGSNDNTIHIWDAETGAEIGQPLEGHTHWVHSVAYSPDGRRIISGSGDNTIRIWDAETGAIVGEPLKGHADWVFSVAYSPDGRRIISGSRDNTIRVWDAETGAIVGEPLEGHTDRVLSVTYSSDGRRVISGSGDNTIRIWDAETGAVVGEPLEGHTDWVHSVAYSPDGRRIISGSRDKTIRIWDAATAPTVNDSSKGHTNPISSNLDSAKPRRLFSIVGHQTTRIYDSAGDSAIATDGLYLDSTGWVRHPGGGLLFWVPEDCRDGLTCPAILTIPMSGHHRRVRLNLEGFSYGSAWTNIKTADP
ncbi:hypothetical protein FRC19_003851 [Serendipita sp. 401]|nr:hypothetical protein FRC19_003851 [Serendipita sp. 401]